jgi:c-di-GMP-related signal transduction protein
MEAFIARQPIFTKDKKVYGYELLFRSSLENVFRHPDPDQATITLILNSFFLFNFQSLTGGRRAFINATRDILLKGYFFLIPKELIVVEIPETLEPEPPVIEACKKLKRAGYLLAMDDFVERENLHGLLELADFVKVDFQSTRQDEWASIYQKISPRGIRLLAEKVETPQVFEEALQIGYTYFQGNFFSEPMVLQQSGIPAYKLRYLQFVEEMHRHEMDLQKIEEFMERCGP